MRRLSHLLIAVCVAATLAFAEGKESQGESGGMEAWEWANFMVLAGGLGYLAVKNGGPFLAGRSAQIRRDLEESAAVRRQAEARVAEVEARIANLQSEIAALRAASERDVAAEGRRVTEQTAALVARLQARAEQDIAAATKIARWELKRNAAQLALDLAEGKIRARVDGPTQDSLVGNFVSGLDGPSGPRRN